MKIFAQAFSNKASKSGISDILLQRDVKKSTCVNVLKLTKKMLL